MSTQEPTMTEHDTTMDNAHVRAINAALGNIIAGANRDREFNAIMDHTDALAAQLAAAEAERDAERERSERFCRMVLAARACDTDPTPAHTDEWYAARRALYEHGDLPTDGSTDDA